jgi:glycosyltransferase involved in cell wall biosynthesis
MKFSIITPSFNQGRFIADCIESVRQQAYPHEHLIFDACSGDETLEVLKRHADLPELTWVSEPDKGQCDAINKGFLRANGDWVMWLNADDFLLPGALEKVAAFIEKHPDADVVYGGWNFTDADKRVTKTVKVFPFDLRMLIHYGPYIASTACFFRKKTVIDEGFLLNTKFRFNMDGEYYARLGRAGKRFLYLPEILAGFRVHEQNVSYQYLNQKGMDGIFRQQQQMAESAAIRRAYGFTLFRNSMSNAIVDALLWYYYRIKKITVKILHGSYGSVR